VSTTGNWARTRAWKIVDLETVIDPEVAEPAPLALLPQIPGDYPCGLPVPPGLAPPRKERLPPPPCWRVVSAAAITITVDDTEAAVTAAGAVLFGDGERAIVSTVVGSIRANQTLVTWNGRRFDVPVLLARAVKHGLVWPWFFGARGARYRYTDEGHLDLSDALTDWGASDPAKLSVWGRLVGAPLGKLASGGDVAGMWARGEKAEVADYNFGDAVLTGYVLASYLVTQGSITPEQAARIREQLAAIHPRVIQLEPTAERQGDAP
jgi:hypothetical protein